MPRLSLYLVRHGETEWSLSGQHTGRTDIPLTAHGEDQARELVPWFRDIHFARVFTSPRQRARRTCALAGLGALAEIEPDQKEADNPTISITLRTAEHTEANLGAKSKSRILWQ